METFNRLAGVRDASKPLPPPPPPIPQDEPSESALSRRASRASLPRDLHRTPSRKSIKSSKTTPLRRSQEVIPPLPQNAAIYSTKEETNAELEQSGRPSHETAASDEEFEWGPSHPCFPHPNPHCVPDSEEHHNTKVIRIKRDWLIAGDLYPQYQNLYPDILDPLVSDNDFRMLITGINTRLEQIFNPWQMWSWIDAILGVLTGFLWDDFGWTATKRGIKDFESFINGWNEQKARAGQEVKIVQLRRTGFMSLDFVIPDPGLDTAEPEAGTKEQAV